MIKKSVFENDLIAGMQRELRAHEKKQGINNLVKAADYLHSAMDIFEEAGLTSKADQVLKILHKISEPLNEVGSMPSMEDWKKAGITIHDLKEFKSNPIAKAKVNVALRDMGYTTHHMAKLLGPGNVMDEKEAREIASPEHSFGKMWNWMQNPHGPVNPNTVKPGEEITFKSISHDANTIDKHTKGLTSDKMVKNIEQHGHPMNLADDGFVDDLLNANIDDNTLEVTDGDDPNKTFEDSD